MRKIRFTIDTGFINCSYERVEEFDNDITDEELEQLAEEFVWENIHVDYFNMDAEEDEE